MELSALQIDELANSLVDSHDKLVADLIALRKRHNLTQEAVAERMGVSQPTVAAFERYDANPTLSTIRRYALSVGASIAHIVGDRCCDLEAERFDSIVGAATRSWKMPRPSIAWDWEPGKVEISAFQ